MKKIIKLTLIMALAVITLSGCSKSTAEQAPKADTENKVVKIGVTQIVEHPSLDAIRSGIYKALEDNNYIDGENIELELLNAQGSMENTMAIANAFLGDKKDLVIGITTPSAQALLNKMEDTPIIYSAVTDPESAGLVGDNITGVSDMTPVRKQLELLVELLPETKTVGMLYNTGELNSEIQVEMAKEITKDMGLELLVSAITNSNEVATALDYVLENVDALYVQKDNTLASAFPVIVKKANEKNIPIMGAVSDYVQAGALATDGPSEFEIGYTTGEMVVRVLNGEDISDIESSVVTDTKIEINEEVAKMYGIEHTK